MPTALYEVLALALLAATLGFAVARPRGLPEAIVAVPAALALVAVGALSGAEARSELRELAPTVLFLAAVLVLADLSERHGVFAAAGSWMARASGGRPVALLGLVFGVAAVVTAALSLDATIVLLTPAVFQTVLRLRVRAKPHVYACTHLANSGSLLLPVSNLTNLLAYRASGLTFSHFAALMALPWLAAIAVEWFAFRRFFDADLGGRGVALDDPVAVPLFAVTVLGLTLVGFFVTSAFGVSPAWAALAGAIVLAAPLLRRRTLSPTTIGSALDLPFLAFVLGLGLIVKAVSVHGLGDLVADVVPTGHSLAALLAIAVLAAILASLVNNLPAVLLLLPAVAGAGPVLAVLVGVNIGPNLTYTGSLATLLWRRILQRHDAPPSTSEFVRLGAITVPLGVVAATVALWVSLRVA